MNRIYLPLEASLVLIVSLALVEGKMRDRWGTPGVEAAELGKRFDQVPKKIGDWVGEDLPVEEVTRKTAGAVNYVSRLYTNSKNRNTVNLWLIIGHSRDVCRHTPTVCYPSQGFRQTGDPLKHHIDVLGEEPAEFFTATFSKEDPSGRHLERVFWAWNHPDTDIWEAPDNARVHYGLSRALYKLYFVGNVLNDENTIDSSASVDFAKLMLPALNAALFPEKIADTVQSDIQPAGDAPAEEAPAEEAPAEEAPATESLEADTTELEADTAE